MIAAVTALAQLRAEAFATATDQGLRTADAADSPALRDDLAVLDELRRRAIVLRGLTFELTDPVVQSVDAGSAAVVVTSTSGAHEVVGTDGTLLGQGPPGQPRRVTVHLVRAGEADGVRWQIERVE